MAIEIPRKLALTAAMIFLAATSCASVTRNADGPTRLEAVALAEAFVLRHGFTANGHPAELPVVRVELNDMFKSTDEILKARLARVQVKAFATAKFPPQWDVLFHPGVNGHGCTWAVVVPAGKDLYMLHTCFDPPSKRVIKPLPSNSSFKPMPLRGTA